MSAKIRISGALQNNLKNINLEIDTNEFMVITGVSGSGKSSLAIDTLFSEGQNRYLETFSTYARQILNSANKPMADKIEGILPAILVNQKNTIKHSHSTVGTITEICDYLKLFFANNSKLFCKKCNALVQKNNPESIFQNILDRTEKISKPKIIISFDFLTSEEIKDDVLKFLASKGYLNIHQQNIVKQNNGMPYIVLNIIQDRLILANKNKTRFLEAVNTALSMGKNMVTIQLMDKDEIINTWKYSGSLYCTNCNIKYYDITSDHFSFSSPLGACIECNGFGNKIVIDIDKVIPDKSISLLDGAIKPWRTDTFKSCQMDLQRYATKHSIPLSKPWKDLKEEEKNWVINGDASWENNDSSWKNIWYGVKNFFEHLESKSYKMHIRILLSKYRKHIICPKCKGNRLKKDSLLWYMCSKIKYENNEIPSIEFQERKQEYKKEFNISDILNSPLEQTLILLKNFSKNPDLNEISTIQEIIKRIETLNNIGVGYLTLNRQSKTLSGGELQRINLTTALGSSLINTLFIIDEPTNGLHYCDVHKIIKELKQLRDMGNCVIVIEHNKEAILSADRLIEMGPGSGINGGNIIFDDHPSKIIKSNTITGKYIQEKNHTHKQTSQQNNQRNIICITGACANNLKNINLEIPLNNFICITGISGSGKSSLVKDIIYSSIMDFKETGNKKTKEVKDITGIEHITETYLIDNSPLIKSSRSTPASYLGIFEIIRDIFAKADLSIERNYKPNVFSMNSGLGRCPECEGKGFKKIEMQFISDIYLECEECEGKRFRPEILEVKIYRNDQAYSIDQVLDMTIQEAMIIFNNDSIFSDALSCMMSLGLPHIILGQTISIMSNGEIRRLKLAKYLMQFKSENANENSLLLLDEPTAGLHINEIDLLITVLKDLVKSGNTVIVVEHNLQLISSSDWICDLGPGAGEKGGEIVAVGTPENIKKSNISLTGKALREQDAVSNDIILQKQYFDRNEIKRITKDDNIKIFNAYENNLKNINLELPLGKFIAITGVSGSGKSTIAFDILFNEGQRRYLMTMNAYARSIIHTAKKPRVDKIINLPPTAAISQRLNSAGHKSTVGTISEINNFLRLLFSKLGQQHCYKCGSNITSLTIEQIISRIKNIFYNKIVIITTPIKTSNKTLIKNLIKQLNLSIDINKTQENTIIYLPIAEIKISKKNEILLNNRIKNALEYSDGFVQISEKAESACLKLENKSIIYSTKQKCFYCQIDYPKIDSQLFSYNNKKGWCDSCHGTGMLSNNQQSKKMIDSKQYDNDLKCKICNGKRLNNISLSVLWKNLNINDLISMSIDDLKTFFNKNLTEIIENKIANEIVKEIIKRLDFMANLGIGYLSLNRSEPTLSGGELQRVHLSSQLGSASQGICYILDEPTIGLHPRDNKSLIKSLVNLTNNGNTVVVVEHDPEVIKSASYLIEIGPGAGVRGGTIINQGPMEKILKDNDSFFTKNITHKYVNKLIFNKKNSYKNNLEIKNASKNNLNNVSVKFPLGFLNVVTGVSGSGKSTLIRNVLFNNIKSKLDNDLYTWEHCQNIKNFESIDKILSVDQTPIGKNSRSCPATFIGFWDEIRKIFSNSNESKIRGWTASRFSFNSKEGRCEECKGTGIKTIEMNFMPNAESQCDVCNGSRFNSETKTVEFSGYNIGEILSMNVDQALKIFANFPKISHPLELMQEIGLGYLPIGQSSSNLSGGEAQRIKIVTELSKMSDFINNKKNTLYILDEPTIGLSSYDIKKLVLVLRKLTELNNTVIVIEHNLDFIIQSDWIIDIGPEGGRNGGQLLFQGTIDSLLKKDVDSYTKEAIIEYIQQ
ncbi:excinuclease ABC subunit UvrA [Candidatus Kinetoplastidibacterium crithidiae]|uniref:UvrABC system protein A n=1 Tax=Candidatus Kinetoplastidibacterium crithidiae TCC036E TaxID=1208918 RepID=M1LUQ6_9PROT|nr:excinuclease ABC subunit UvrA [Candidatus Kinetoplastibacterium crithidii]AFZ82509.1 excinuclease ABC subunit A [Candidatus Kinetoplastibacterium crithidii (ex Angomonas deanei ATCC 30255)]AGF47831.1 dual-domain excinuclease ABC subunit A uvrA2 [Candidatus Kinetoplastibacterium crithidii TCC036E]